MPPRAPPKGQTKQAAPQAEVAHVQAEPQQQGKIIEVLL